VIHILNARRSEIPKRPRAFAAWSALGLAVLLSSCAGDGNELDSTGVPLGPPEIQSDRSTIELSLVEGTSDTSSFVVTNVGGFPLEIQTVVATEDFLHPLFDGPILVGKDLSEEISFRVDALDPDRSPDLGTIRVSSNADLVPLLSVSVSLEITPAPEPEISVTPDTLRSTILEGLVDTVSFEVFNSGTADLLIAGIESNLAEIVALEQEWTILPNQSVTVPLRVDAVELEPGQLDGLVAIESNDEDEPMLVIPVSLRVTLAPEPEISIRPDALRATIVEGTVDTVSFTILNIGTADLLISGIVSDLEGAEPLQQDWTIAPDRLAFVPVRIDARELEPGQLDGTLEILSNDEDESTVAYPIALVVTHPEISVRPDTLRSTILEASIDTVSFEILNTGTADLLVSSVVSDLEEVVPLRQEWTILPNESVFVPVEIDALGLEAGPLEGALEIVSNDRDEPTVRIPVRLTIDSAGPFPATLSAIQTNVFDATCSLAGCHGEAFPPLNLRLAPGEAWSNLYEVPSFFDPDLFLVKPFDSENSFLMIKLVEFDERRIGERMPIADQPYLTDEELDVVRRWIDEGALDN